MIYYLYYNFEEKYKFAELGPKSFFLNENYVRFYALTGT